MPAPQPYYGDTAESAACIRKVNEAAARAKADHPGRFIFCAALPLPDVGAAVREAIYALDTLGADGVKLATNSRGQYLGDPALDTLMAVLNSRKAVAIIHPHRPTPCNEATTAATQAGSCISHSHPTAPGHPITPIKTERPTKINIPI